MSRWLPVLALVVAILVTGPLGPTVAVLLYQGVPPAPLSEVRPDTGSFVAMDSRNGSAFATDEQGRSWVLSEDGGRILVEDATSCAVVAARGSIGVCAGRELVVVDLERAAVLVRRELPSAATAIHLDAGLVAVGLQDGTGMQLPLLDGRLGQARVAPVSQDPLVSVLQAGFIVLFADESHIAVVDMKEGRVRSRAASETGAFDFVRSGLKFDVAVGLGGVRRLTLANVDAPEWGAGVDLGDDIRSISATNSWLRYACTDEGATPVVSSIPGVLWALPSRGFHHQMARVAGSWVLTTDGAVARVDVYAGKEMVRVGVSVLAALLLVGFLGVLIRRRPADLLRRVGWRTLGFACVATRRRGRTAH
jgi:hypothetical protein